MNPLQQLKSSIENLNGNDLLHQKDALLSLVDTLALAYPGNGNGNGHGETHHLRLSPREREVMGMILSGRRLKEIAATLDISVKTVTTHRSRLLRKLGIEDNLGLFRYGVRNGLITV
ncbi:MAG TPA: LuxR C-terminal-related transcriptional regulator [Thermoanaerobaculia bacterium]